MDLRNGGRRVAAAFVAAIRGDWRRVPGPATSIGRANCYPRGGLRKAGAAIIRSERKSGTTAAGRPELATVLGFLRERDTLLVTRIDRLARSLMDLEGIVGELRAKGAQPPPLPQGASPADG